MSPATSPSRDLVSVSPAVPPAAFDQVAERRTLRVDEVTVDAGTQVREAVAEHVVDDYAERLGEGVRFPPVVVFRDGSRYCLADGFHRLQAFRRAGRDEIEADVYVGTRADALWFALGANRTHGERLSRADKRHAIELAFRTWPDLSQGRIARQVGCSKGYVCKVRAQVFTSEHLPERVLGEDGKSYPANRRPSDLPVSPEISLDRSGPQPASEPDADPVPDPAVFSVPDSEVAGESGQPLPEPAVDGGASPGSAPSRPSGRQPSQRARDRSNRIVSVVTFDAQNLLAQEDLIEFAALDRSMLSGWIVGLERARLDLGRLIRRLREEAVNGEGEPAGEGDDPSDPD